MLLVICIAMSSAMYFATSLLDPSCSCMNVVQIALAEHTHSFCAELHGYNVAEEAGIILPITAAPCFARRMVTVSCLISNQTTFGFRNQLAVAEVGRYMLLSMQLLRCQDKFCHFARRRLSVSWALQ